MNIFDKRPLSLILCIMLGGFVFFSFSEGWIRYTLLAIPAILLCFLFIPKLSRAKKLLSSISALALMLSILLSYLYFDVWFKASERFSGDVTIDAVITEIKENDYSYSVIIKTESIDETPMSSYKLLIILDKDNSYSLDTGNKISFNATLSAPDNNYYYSEGISAFAEPISDIKVNEEGKIPLSERILILRENFARYTIMLSDNETGGLLAALLMGERDYLSSALKLDFKRIGISHVLALSGMHLAILSLGINKLLSLLQIKKRPRTVIIMLFSAAYMMITGFSVTIVRAGIMLMISSLLFLLSSTHDSVTSLCLAVFLICIAAPYSIYDIALWLSAFATLGVIMAAEYFESCPKTSTNAILTPLLFSVFAISATLLISVKTFGALSLAAPITTLIFSLIIEVFMYLGSIMLIIGDIIPISYLLKWIYRAMVLLADEISDIELIYIRADSPIILTLITIFTVIFFAFLILKIKRKRLGVKIITISFITLFSVLAIISATVKKEETILFSGSDKCDLFLVNSESETALISSSQYSKATAYKALEFAETNGIYYLDKLYFTHYSKNLTEELEIILSDMRTDEIYIPTPKNKSEEEILLKIENHIKKFNTSLFLYSESDTVYIGDAKIFSIYSEIYGKDSSVNAFSIVKDSKIYTYVSSGMLKSGKSDIIPDLLSISNSIILGSHGKKYPKAIYLDEKYDALSLLVISGEKIYITQESAEYYDKNGCEIYSHPQVIDIIIDN